MRGRAQLSTLKISNKFHPYSLKFRIVIPLSYGFCTSFAPFLFQDWKAGSGTWVGSGNNNGNNHGAGGNNNNGNGNGNLNFGLSNNGNNNGNCIGETPNYFLLKVNENPNNYLSKVMILYFICTGKLIFVTFIIQ